MVVCIQLTLTPTMQVVPEDIFCWMQDASSSSEIHVMAYVKYVNATSVLYDTCDKCETKVYERSPC